MQKRLGIIDVETGEVLGGGVPVWVNAKIKCPYEEGYFMISQRFLKEFAARRDVGLEAYRVFLYLDAHLNFRNVIQIPQTEIAKALGMKKQSVNRAIKKLEQLGIITRDRTVGQHVSAWRLNPNVGWRGKTRELRPAIEQHLRDTIPPKKLN